MTDRLGEALALYDKWGATFLDEAAITAPILAAARNWQTLTNPTDELIERIAATLYTQKWGPSMSGARPGAKERETAYAVLDALSDTPTTEENPPQDFVND